MRRNHFAVLLVFCLFIGLSFTLISAQDVGTSVVCEVNSDCLYLDEPGKEYYCNPIEQKCFLRTVQTSNPVTADTTIVATTAVATPTLEGKVDSLQSTVSSLSTDVAALKSNLANVKSDVSSTKNSIDSFKSQLNQISADVRSLSESLTSISPQVSKALAGQATLAGDLNETKEEVDIIEQGLKKEQSFTGLIKGGFFLLLLVAITLSVMYYLNRGKKSKKINPKILDYITSNVKSGKKFSDIRAGLLQAGWSAQDIAWAYKETMRFNYQKFKKGTVDASVSPVRARSPPKSTLPSFDKNKIISISIVTVLLIVGVFFLLSGTVGKAIFTQKLIDSETGETSYVVTCTSPQIVAPSGDACCTDENQNNICDIAERDVEQTGGACTDNLQCATGQKCIDGNCGSLSNLYRGSVYCEKMCNYHSVALTTSDGEIYRGVKPKQGSYTAAGALEWAVVGLQDHCDGEAAIVPITIIKKRTGEILSEEIITLRKGESSKVLTHPYSPNIAFSLRVDQISELCS
jgi:outer membrane murein-binding lipoprotein Lpp